MLDLYTHFFYYNIKDKVYFTIQTKKFRQLKLLAIIWIYYYFFINIYIFFKFNMYDFTNNIYFFNFLLILYFKQFLLSNKKNFYQAYHKIFSNFLEFYFSIKKKKNKKKFQKYKFINLVSSEKRIIILFYNSRTLFYRLVIKNFSNSLLLLKKNLFFIWKYSSGHSSKWIIRHINFIFIKWLKKWLTYSIIIKKQRKFIFHYFSFITWLSLKQCSYIIKIYSSKSLLWKIKNYFGSFNPYLLDFWIFGDKYSGSYIIKIIWFFDEK